MPISRFVSIQQTHVGAVGNLSGDQQLPRRRWDETQQSVQCGDSKCQDGSDVRSLEEAPQPRQDFGVLRCQQAPKKVDGEAQLRRCESAELPLRLRSPRSRCLGCCSEEAPGRPCARRPERGWENHCLAELPDGSRVCSHRVGAVGTAAIPPTLAADDVFDFCRAWLQGKRPGVRRGHRCGPV